MRFRHVAVWMIVGGLVAAMPPVFADDTEAADRDVKKGPERRGSLFQRLDRNGDGKLARDEVPEQARERLLPLFDRFGKDELTKEDLASLRPASDGPPDPGALFSRLDRDESGTVSVEELKVLPDPVRQRLQLLLERKGKDEITRDEFARLRPPRPQRDGAQRPDGERRRDGDRPRDGERRDRDRRSEDRDRPRADQPDRSRDSDRDRPRDAQRGPSGGPRFFRLVDADRDGRLSRDELAQIAEAFEELDLNKDGQLDPREMMGMPPGDGPRRPLDRDRRDARPDDRGRRDRDRPRREGRDGGEKESRRGDREGRPIPEATFARLDRDKDGKISRDEAPERMERMFDRIDTDRNGTIDSPEAARAFEQMRNRNRDGSNRSRS